MSTEEPWPDVPEDFWEQLFQSADKAVRTTLAALPAEIRTRAEPIPFLLEKWPDPDTDLLGEYLGFEPGHITSDTGAIVLYLGTIHDFCREEGSDFEEEVKTTYLHELGHALGLDEDDLDERGLQ